MANDIFTASIAGVEFDASDISDGIQNSVIVHEFPDRDGALLEHSGEKARVVRIRAYFFNDTYGQHEAVIAQCSVKDSYELMHPKYGVLMGMISEIQIRHDDHVEYCEMDITFLEDLIGSGIVVTVEESPVPPVRQSFLQGLANQMQALSRDISSDMLSLQNAVSIRSYTNQLSACVGAAEAMLSTIAQPADSLIATIQFTTDLPGTIIGALANTVERYSALYDALRTAPVRFADSYRSGMEDLQAALGTDSQDPAKQLAAATFQRYARISGAMQLSLDMAGMYDADEQARNAWSRSENQPSFDAAGNYLNPPVLEPIMTIDDIEQSLASVRSEIQTAVDLARDFRDLQDMAATLLAHADKIKIERERIVTIAVAEPLPLMLFCLQRGLPYNAAARILAVNPQIDDPNFVSGDVRIYVQ